MQIAKIQFIALAVIINMLLGQATSFSGNVVSRFGHGNQFSVTNEKTDYDYKEILIDLYFYRGGFTNWLQYEYSDPPEYGRRLNTIRRFRLNYKKNLFSIDLGDIYRSWDRGLILSQFDDQQIDFDNSLRGIGFLYYADNFSIDILGGFRKQYQSSPFNTNLRKHDEALDHKVFAGRFGFNYFEILNGFTFLVDNVDFPIKTRGNTEAESSSNSKNYLAGYSLEFAKSQWDIAFDAIYKYTKIDPNLYFLETDFSDFSIDSIPRDSQKGYSIYSILNSYFGNWTLTLDYKKYHLAVMDPTRRETYPYPEGSLIYQNPPLTFFEHSSTLLNRNIHPLDKNDEIGYQFALNGLVRDNISLLFNYSHGSRNTAWKRAKPDVVWQSEPWEEEETATLLPLSSPAANSFSEGFAEITTYLFGDRVTLKGALSKSEQDLILFENIKSSSYDSLSYEFINALTIPLDLSISLPKEFSAEIKYQWQRLEKGIITEVRNGADNYSKQTTFYYEKVGDSNINKKDFQYVSILQLGVHKAPYLGLNLLIEKDRYEETGVNSENLEINPLEELLENIGFSNHLTWLSVEALINIASKYRLSVFYGSEKGGLQCRNGVCRIIQPFNDGFRVGLTTYF